MNWLLCRWKLVVVVSCFLYHTNGLVARISRPATSVIVIGGGAAGYFSAIECARVLKEGGLTKYDITVLEAGKDPLSKVLISGGGRCNVMHNPMKGANEIAKGYPRGSKELLGPLNVKFGPWETFDWFTSRLPKGVELKTEDDGRVFPSTDTSITIAGTLIDAAKKYSVQIRCGARVVSIQQQDDKFAVSFVSSSQAVFDSIKKSSVDEDETVINDNDTSTSSPRSTTILTCDRLIVATGSSRGGYDMVKKLGHQIIDPLPSLFSFKIDDRFLHDLAGVSVQRSTVKLIVPKDFQKGPNKHLARPQSLPLFTQKGPLLVTHQGMSGPAVLRLSAFGARITAALKYKFEVEICWLPDVNDDQLFEHLWAEKNRHPTRQMGKGFPAIPESLFLDDDDDDDAYANNTSYMNENASTDDSNAMEDSSSNTGKDKDATMESSTRGGLTRRLWGYILTRSGLSPENRWEKASKTDITKLVQELLYGRYSVTGRGLYRDEFVTCGGVPLKEVSFDTFESKIVPGMHLCGEILDIDGVTGGYNFQSAWTGGWTAGNSAGNSLLLSSAK